MASIIRGDDNFDSGVTATDEKADAFGYSVYRSGQLTLYPGFNSGQFVAWVNGQVQGDGGSFTGGSFVSGPNFGQFMRYMAIAVRTS